MSGERVASSDVIGGGTQEGSDTSEISFRVRFEDERKEHSFPFLKPNMTREQKKKSIFCPGQHYSFNATGCRPRIGPRFGIARSNSYSSPAASKKREL
ncbi:hypothetical protein AVEN_188984-1, partial [Araneus ventricosus]